MSTDAEKQPSLDRDYLSTRWIARNRAPRRPGYEDVPEPDEDWSCIDCGIPLEPGAPPICEECVDG